ncbi:LHFPL tetraspan subfamily member 6 protein-like isoform X3 [Bolinopsis microptera]|uniref:LHFPL tetraspan subfamily member 6 protein-like isoform X3 n=1 Tax=Bolinopsis microptera TaxID=2820187 RepID=UPI0030795157
MKCPYEIPLSCLYFYYDCKSDVNYRWSMLPYKTWKSVVWFLLTWLLTIGLLISACTNWWLVGPPDSDGETTHIGFFQDCSVKDVNKTVNGTELTQSLFRCNGIRTDFQSLMLLIVTATLGVGILSLFFLTILTLVYCFCDQLTACGRSFHTLAGIWQATSSVLVLIGVFLFPILWEQDWVTNVCKSSKIFVLGDCVPGYSLYLAIACSLLGYFVAGFSTSLDVKTFDVTEFGSMESLDTYSYKREI